MTAPPLDLLLAYDDGPAAALPADALDPRASGDQPIPGRLDAENADIDDLAAQRWCVVVPDGDRGRRLRDLVDPLVRRRAAEQRAPALTVPVPPRMSLGTAHDWLARLRAGFAHPRDVPRYFLLLGDLDEVPLAVQQALALADRCPGRLCFDRDDELAAHAARLAAHDPTTAPSLALHAAATDATSDRARARLLVPVLDQLAADRDLGELRVTDLGERTTLRPEPPHTALMTVSHGYGGDRHTGFATPDHRRREQGALVLADRLLRADSLPPALLPSGFWVMFACYSAGTPETSAYAPWLRGLHGGAFAGIADAITRALPGPGERPFIAALPKAALAAEHGPLACFGHVDVVWEYSYQHHGRAATTRPGKFTRLLADACHGHRAGALTRSLARASTEAALHLLAAVDEPPSDRLRQLWLLHHDLAGFILLGDPAVRLTTPPRTAPHSVDSVAHSSHPRTAPHSVDSVAHSSHLRPATSVDPTAPPKSPRSVESAPTVPPALVALARKLGADRLEEALAHALVSEPARKVAARLGIEVDELRALQSAYRAAGRRALGLDPP